MPKAVIEIPEWVDPNIMKELKKMFLEKLLERISGDYANPELYRLYLELKYPDTENVEFDMDTELKFLKEMRVKEKARLE
ncbi:hypothetical protein [Candidatus Pyrohabitans sp.]